MLGRAARFLGIGANSQEMAFIDKETFSKYAVEDIAFVSSIKGRGARVMTGVGKDRFNPKGTYSREQAIIILLRLHEAK